MKQLFGHPQARGSTKTGILVSWPNSAGLGLQPQNKVLVLAGVACGLMLTRCRRGSSGTVSGDSMVVRHFSK